MKQKLYACIYVADLPVQALLRLRRDLKSAPVAVLEGSASHQTICSMNQHARLRGASIGITRPEAEEITGLHLLSRSRESEAAAKTVVLECASQFSPRIESSSGTNSCTFNLDIAGSERLFGPAEKLVQRLRLSLMEAGFRTSIAVSANFDAARLKAVSGPGISIIPFGEEAKSLANLPIALLNVQDDALETFAHWGIHTLGELTNLPETELVARLGQKARVWRDLANGKAEHLFQAIEPDLSLEEFYEFDSPVDQIDSLLFVGARMIECLSTRASRRAMSLASLSTHFKLENGSVHVSNIRPAIPSTDHKFLLKLLHLELAMHPPHGSVIAITLDAEAGPSSKIQLGLFVPQLPEPSRLDVTLARLKAIVGADRVGSPVLDDTHRPGSFHIEDFNTRSTSSETHAGTVRMALRRLRPSVPVRVEVQSAKPTIFMDGNERFVIAAAFGPWKTSGYWWSMDACDLEEWDILASNSEALSLSCLLVHDLVRGEWLLEAMYD